MNQELKSKFAVVDSNSKFTWVLYLSTYPEDLYICLWGGSSSQLSWMIES